MSGSRSKQKGAAAERGLVKQLQQWGFDAHRVPQVDNAPDVLVTWPGGCMVVECKRHKKANVRAALTQLLNSDAPELALRAAYIRDDFRAPFWIVPHDTFKQLLKKQLTHDQASPQTDSQHLSDSCHSGGCQDSATATGCT